MAINKVDFGGRTLIDLTGDTVDAAHLLAGYSAHGRDGEPVEGACDFDVNSTVESNPITAARVRSGYVGFVNGQKITGTMASRGTAGVSIANLTPISKSAGYYSAGTQQIDPTEAAKIISENIRSGISILGVAGGFSNFTEMQTGTWTPPATITTSNNTSSANRIDVGITDPKLIIIMRNAYDSTGLKVGDTHQLVASYWVAEESNPESTTAGWRGRSTVLFINGSIRASTSIYWGPVSGTSYIQCTLASGYTAPVQVWRWLAYA